MSAGLRDLLERMREHPSFAELFDAIPEPAVKKFRPSQSEQTEAQTAEWIFKSGCQHQHTIWRDYLTRGIPRSGDVRPSQQEKP